MMNVQGFPVLWCVAFVGIREKAGASRPGTKDHERTFQFVKSCHLFSHYFENPNCTKNHRTLSTWATTPRNHLRPRSLLHPNESSNGNPTRQITTTTFDAGSLAPSLIASLSPVTTILTTILGGGRTSPISITNT